MIPAADTRDVVNGIIFDELCKGAVTAESRAIYMKVAADLAFDGDR